MAFNLHSARKKSRAIDGLRSLSDDAADLRPSDIDEVDDLEWATILPTVKVAQHGRANGPSWMQQEPNYSPYNTSYLVNKPPGLTNDRWRQPGGGVGDVMHGGDQHINDDSDKSKSGRGQAMDDDFNGKMRNIRLRELLKHGDPYIVEVRMDNPNDDTARTIFGPEGQTSKNSVFVEVQGYEEAVRLQRKIPSALIRK